jgi:hypothetical protein
MSQVERTPIPVFEMFRHWAEEPVTVFAKDLSEAESIYSAWIKAHHPERPVRPITVHPYAGFSLEGRPELVFACHAGKKGIGRWDRLGRRWAIAAPEDPPLGDLARPASSVKYHSVAANDGDELMVFAETFEEAVGFYVAWHLEAYGDVPGGIMINRKSRWQLVLALGSLRDDMDAGVAGVARWTADDGWHIVAPEDGTVASDDMR